jgi:hypothetical protein
MRGDHPTFQVKEDLPPGKYSFRVIASNSDGVWNDTATKLDLSVAPAYYQTNWFRALCAVIFMALVGRRTSCVFGNCNISST